MADPKPLTVPLGRNSAEVVKFDSDGNRIAVDPEQAARDVIGSANASGDHPSILQQGASWFNEHMGNLAGTIGAGADQIVNPVLRATGLTDKAPMSIEEAQAKAKGLVPSTPSGVAAMLLGGPLASRLGLIRGTVAGAAGGAALEGAAGGSPTVGAINGGIGTALPAVVGKAVNTVAQAGQKLATKVGLRQEVVEPYAQRVLDGMKEDVPALYNAVKDLPGSAPAKLAAIHDPQVSSVMGQAMRDAEAPIIRAMPEIANPAPSGATSTPNMGRLVLTPQQQAALSRMPPEMQARVAAQARALSGQPAAPQQPTSIQTENAFATLKQLKADARDAFDPMNPAASKPLRDAAATYEQKLMAAIEAVDPKLAKAWADAMAQYNRGLRYQELGKAALQGADPTAQGTPFSPEGLVRHYFAAPGRYAPSQLPGFNRSFFQGTELGAQPVITDPSVYARAPLGSVKAKIPLGQFVTRPGQQYGAPKTAAALEQAARTGLIDLTEHGSGSR